jgi:hypothetical protein
MLPLSGTEKLQRLEATAPHAAPQAALIQELRRPTCRTVTRHYRHYRAQGSAQL